MDPNLKAMCLTPVRFKPKQGVTPEGDIVFGSLTTAVNGYVEYTKRSRSVSKTGESSQPSATIWLDAGDFSSSLVGVGSVVVLPDGQEEEVTSVQSWLDHNVVDHWQISIG